MTVNVLTMGQNESCYIGCSNPYPIVRMNGRIRRPCIDHATEHLQLLLHDHEHAKPSYARKELLIEHASLIWRSDAYHIPLILISCRLNAPFNFVVLATCKSNVALARLLARRRLINTQTSTQCGRLPLNADEAQDKQSP